jgi:hypothetical protein
MTLVNETGQGVSYWITCASGDANCGDIAVDGLADLPFYDNQQNVTVSFLPLSGGNLSIDCGSTGTGQQVELALKAE